MEAARICDEETVQLKKPSAARMAPKNNFPMLRKIQPKKSRPRRCLRHRCVEYNTRYVTPCSAPRRRKSSAPAAGCNHPRARRV